MATNQLDFIPVLLHIGFCVIMIFAVIFVSNMLGPKHRSKRKSENFECGLDTIGNARSPFAIKYFLVAILFVLFDIEVLFMYPWAANFKALGWSAFIKMGVFVFLLAVGYFYIVKRKALEWEK